MPKFYRILSALLFLVISSNLHGQWGTPGSSTDLYANHWIKFDGRPYVKIGVRTKGIQRISVSSLPSITVASVTSPFTTVYPNYSKYQLWHRGKEVAIISADASGIVFYGEPNDGAADSLLYRPTTTRLNPNFSLFGEIGAYFLTVVPDSDNSAVSRASSSSVTPSVNNLIGYHIEKSTTKFSDLFSVATTNGPRLSLANGSLDWLPAVSHSYYNYGKGWTGPNLFYNNTYKYDIKMPNWNQGTSVSPVLEFLIYGRSNLSGIPHRINASIANGPSGTYRSLNDYSILDHDGVKRRYTLLPNQDISSSGNASLSLLSSTNSSEERYSLSFYTIEYPSFFNQENLSSRRYILPTSSTTAQKSIQISNLTGTEKIYDISDVDKPIVINGGSSQHFAINQVANKLTTLFVSSEIQTNQTVASVSFQKIVPADFNYLIITKESLLQSAARYAVYRNSDEGRNFKSLVIDIKQVYDQFNFGEPSPVAIKRFVNYMLSDNNLKKYLLLIGRSGNIPTRMRLEIEGDIPAIGNPASDVLLTAGLMGTNEDIPAIPVGRLTVRTNEEVDNYLDKLKVYESDAQNLTWRKNVLHLTGEKNTSERTEFAGYLNAVQHHVQSTSFGGNLTLQQRVPSEIADATTPANIHPKVNTTGLGFITYFGHGNQTSTMNNIAYVSRDLAYSASAQGKKYPVFYITGCGVGNDFSLSDPTNLNFCLATDWIIAKNQGSVAVAAASFNNWTTPSAKHIKAIYPLIFEKTDADRKTYGHILKEAAEAIVGVSSGSNVRSQAATDLDVMNIHITILFGDPAIRILNTSNGPLPVSLLNFRGDLQEERVVLSWSTASEVSNKEFVVERSADARNFEAIGSVEGAVNSDISKSYSFVDPSSLAGVNYYRLKQVDLNGDFTYSNIVNVLNPKTQKSVFISPNPAANVAKISTASGVRVDSWKVLDFLGKSIMNGTTESEISMQNLKSGIYLVEFKLASGEVSTIKLVKY